MARLSREFYNGDTVEIARKLLGKYLVRRLDGELLAGRITETEAYVGRCDKACHAYGYKKTPRTSTLFMAPGHAYGYKKTARTSTLFMAPGHAYIYFIYGMYHCLNFVTESEGEPSAVLIRAIQPAAGMETMRRLRFGDAPMNAYRRKNFSNGPGKVCKALSLSSTENRMDLTGDTLFVCDSLADIGLPEAPPPVGEVLRCGPRIGIDYAEEARDFPWRFWLEKEET